MACVCSSEDSALCFNGHFFKNIFNFFFFWLSSLVYVREFVLLFNDEPNGEQRKYFVTKNKRITTFFNFFLVVHKLYQLKSNSLLEFCFQCSKFYCQHVNTFSFFFGNLPFGFKANDWLSVNLVARKRNDAIEQRNSVQFNVNASQMNSIECTTQYHFGA